MQYDISTINEYFEALPEERKEGVKELFEVFKTNLPKGFEAQVSYGHIGFVVPFSIYPNGYHCDTNQPLPFINIASQKNHIAIYHMGIYMKPELINWFENEFPKHSSKKLNMGKSCIRFRNTKDIPFDLLGELATKITVDDYVSLYTDILNRKK